MKKPLVSIIVVNFNQKKLTIDCLKSLKKISYKNTEVVLVDNGSDERLGSLDRFIKSFKKFVFVKNDINLGFTGGTNAGYKRVKGKYILLLNNDTLVEKGFLEPLVERMEEDKNIGVLQSKLLLMDNPILLDNVATFLTITGFLFYEGYLEKNSSKYNKFIYSFSAKGASMFIRKSVLKMGLFDDDYFAYFEETDLCWRTWILGYLIGYEPKSIVYHKMGATSLEMKSSFTHYHSFKNRIRTILKNASGGTLVYMLPFHLATCFSLSIYFLFSGQREGSLAIMKAFWWNLTNLPDTFKLRAQVQRLRKVSDKEIFKKVLRNPTLSFYLNHLSLVRKNLSNDGKA